MNFIFIYKYILIKNNINSFNDINFNIKIKV